MVTLKNYEYLNEFQGPVFVEPNKYEYGITAVSTSIVTFKLSDQSKLTQLVQGWIDGETNACFARSKSMDLNDFLIHSNALNIRLSRNLITQSRGDRFREYINK